MNLQCLFGHETPWIREYYDGIWYRQCPRCHSRLAPILVNAESPDITPAQVPAITIRRATKVKKAKRPNAVKFPRSA